MSAKPDERPKEPAQRPAHHLHRALAHHRAHRKRAETLAAEHFQKTTPPPA